MARAAAALAALPPLSAALPSHDWATVPRFAHCANESGPFSPAAAAALASVPVVTLEKFQGLDEAPAKSGAERKIIDAAKQIKAAAGGRKVEVLMYYQVDFARTWYDSGGWFDAKPEFELHDAGGALVVDGGWRIYDFSQQGARDKWVSTLTWAVGSGAVDGVFLDGLRGAKCSAKGGYGFLENVTAAKCAAWIAGLNESLWALRGALPDATLINNPGQLAHASATGLMIERMKPVAGDIALLQASAEKGLLVEARLADTDVVGKYAVPGMFNNSLAAFLIGAGDRAYFGVGGWSTCDAWFVDYPEFSRPLGPPTGLAAADGTRYTRSFATGTSVEIDTGKNPPASCIRWSDGTLSGNAC